MDYFSDWWKVMEFTFGGAAGGGVCLGSVERGADGGGERRERAGNAVARFAHGGGAGGGDRPGAGAVFEGRIHIRFSYTVAGRCY